MKFKPDPEALVMGALANGPLHGYGIVKTLREDSQGIFKMNEGQLYPLLHKMQQEGWILGEWEAVDSGPARKTYTLLEEGKLELERRMQEWSRFSSAVGGLLKVAPIKPEPSHG
jgi:PadR family transcriptional regulator PadR